MEMSGTLGETWPFQVTVVNKLRQSVSKAIRKLDTIDMDEQVKLDIVRDAEYYYSDES